jgi:hypothetical protein
MARSFRIDLLKDERKNAEKHIDLSAHHVGHRRLPPLYGTSRMSDRGRTFQKFSQ